MVILFSAKISEKHQQAFQSNYPNLEFIFCTNISEANQHLGQATVFVTYGEDMDEQTIKKAPHLKWIMVLSAGVDQLPFQAIAERNILVTNSRGIHKTQMAEYTISMLLQVYRQEKQIMINESNNSWDKTVRVKEITGQTIAILGTGAIGQEIARLAQAFRMKTIGLSRSGKAKEFFNEVHTMDNLSNVLSEADFIVSVLPSTKETKHLLKEEHFKQMKNSVVFLNIGRGDVVESSTILKVIQEQEIAHAVLDVFEEEPLPADHPFWGDPNITVTPHISGQSPHYIARSLAIFQENLDTFLTEQTAYINHVNPTRGY